MMETAPESPLVVFAVEATFASCIDSASQFALRLQSSVRDRHWDSHLVCRIILAEICRVPPEKALVEVLAIRVSHPDPSPTACQVLAQGVRAKLWGELYEPGE
jgi:hypothetical protein